MIAARPPVALLLAWLLQAGAPQPDNHLLFEKALVLEETQNRFEEAIALYEDILAATTDPDVRRTWILIGDPTTKLTSY